ncbi:MAG: hypothetical protein UV64_C0003G0014 [Parcubacteria group bacterium GW2011_GWC1_43_11b]|uniref:Transcriptional regulator n=2 Tax=Candidatus Vogeliibacteriota TaxID=1817922 RepID=A0A1G2QCB8_9BACT|nr:MAG: hypothetical protein UV50_C0003G0014 [Parcubacteria group bacterium GW2011_GWB1_42_9]KKS89616.1 MAG: hypothetical protein UV64_C0003G0014 [Parcubacteria group bacterium GW2011_GWC1_43_11b]KKT10067.1 MAG: hypothetical protein UV88_C0002G0014 [Parcubacteria group bacterium GW2011_GWA1_43_21]OHA58053.1 MAG: hypothetical protein A2370_01675 [Candidatus Vogelbacteria bacterium RIFOXYB1_FULL_42_16]OHA58322.1 MAG: hypothetical protein A2607_00350 [Candidatus Vogelbacteria bacterium RIFOXYD1_FU
MEILSKLFGSNGKVKIIRLFLYNPEKVFSLEEVAKKAKVGKAEVRREINILVAGRFLKERRAWTKRGKVSSRKNHILSEDYPYLEALRLLFNSDFFSNRRLIANRFKKCGRLKLLVISGAFVQRLDGPADIVIVGDDLKRPVVDNVVKNIEAETGRELTYAVFDTSDWLYRFHSSDRFVRDLLEFDHEYLVNKIGF